MTLALKMADIEYDAYENGFERGHEAGLQVGIQQGIEQGLERGAHQKALETAQKLIARGYPADDIADLLGLTISQIQEIQ